MAAHPAAATASTEPCSVGDFGPRVLVVMAHPAMLRFTRELLERECGCRVATELQHDPSLPGAVPPDVVVIDASTVPSAGLPVFDQVPRRRVIVIGPELDDGYRRAALAGGAGGWLARDEIADRLGAEVCRVLGCRRHLRPASLRRYGLERRER